MTEFQLYQKVLMIPTFYHTIYETLSIFFSEMSLQFTTAHRTEQETARTIFYLLGFPSLDTIIARKL